MFTASNTIKVYIIKNEQNVYIIEGKQHGPPNEIKPEIKAWEVNTKHETISCIQAHSQTQQLEQ